MKNHQITKLDYNSAITQFGEAVKKIRPKEYVLIVESDTSFTLNSAEAVTPKISVVVGFVTEVNDSGQLAQIEKIHRYYEDGGSFPESGIVEVSLELLSISAIDRIEQDRKFFENF